MNQTLSQNEDLNNRVKLLEAEWTKLLEKYNLKWDMSIEFPIYRQVPDEVKLSLKVIEKHQPLYKMVFSNKK